MPKNKNPEDNIDWSLTTWEGSRRESLRRWAKLPLEKIIAALEEMQELNEMLMTPPRKSGGTIQEKQGNYESDKRNI